MTTHDDETIGRLYGRAYGRAHSDQAAGEESARSAADPGRRIAVDDVDSGWFRRSSAIFGRAVDEALGIRPGAAGLNPYDDPDRIDYAEPIIDDLPDDAGEPAEPAEPDIDPVTLDDLEPGIDRDLRAWITANPDAVLTTATLLTGALHLVEEHIAHSDEIELAEAMARLGYQKAQRRIDGKVSRVFIRTVTGL